MSFGRALPFCSCSNQQGCRRRDSQDFSTVLRTAGEYGDLTGFGLNQEWSNIYSIARWPSDFKRGGIWTPHRSIVVPCCAKFQETPAAHTIRKKGVSSKDRLLRTPF